MGYIITILLIDAVPRTEPTDRMAVDYFPFSLYKKTQVLDKDKSLH